jgi:hypothetical protein
MNFAMILEYLKVILAAPVMIAVIALTFLVMFRADVKALMARIAKVKFPGGEIETSQLEKLKEQLPAKGDVPEPIAKEGAQIVSLPSPASGDNAAQDALTAERSKAALWEYRYLNLFFARGTQHVLDWFAASNPRATTSLFNAVWLPIIPNPNERVAILTALQAHHLITIENDLVHVTPKGREYLQWRGPLPNAATAT